MLSMQYLCYKNQKEFDKTIIFQNRDYSAQYFQKSISNKNTKKNHKNTEPLESLEIAYYLFSFLLDICLT